MRWLDATPRRAAPKGHETFILRAASTSSHRLLQRRLLSAHAAQNPKDYNVMDAVALYQENKCDSFISIGGGSSHDACKGARIPVAHDGRSVNEFQGFNKRENQ